MLVMRLKIDMTCNSRRHQLPGQLGQQKKKENIDILSERGKKEEKRNVVIILEGVFLFTLLIKTMHAVLDDWIRDMDNCCCHKFNCL